MMALPGVVDGTRRASLVRPAAVASAVGYGACIALIALESPWWFRAPAAVVLLLVPGHAAWLLLTGERTGDRAVRLPLTALLGVLVWVGVALLLNAVGVGLRAPTLALTVGSIGACLALAAALTSPAERPLPSSPSPPPTGRVRTVLVIAAATATMIAATWLAAAMIVAPVERYTTLGFVDNKPFAGEIPAVAPGEPVRLNWELRGFGCDPSASLTRVRLTLDGRAIPDIAVDVSAAGDRTLSGAVTFNAPRAGGRHLIELTVQPAAQDGSRLPEPGYVSTPLEVGT